MVYCDKCGTENQENVKFCRDCGNKITLNGEINTIVCIKCDHLNPADTKFCEKCGKKIVFDKETKLKSVIISAMLEYKQWVDENIKFINEGPKSEANRISKEAQLRTNRLLTLLKKSKKETDDKQLLKLIDDRIKDLESESNAINNISEKTVDKSFVCPYCKKEIELEKELQDEEKEYECPLCHKKFKAITGKVVTIRGRINAVVQYGAEPISITLRLKNGTQSVNFKTVYRFLVHTGDRVSFVYLKKFLSNSYKEEPSFLFNLTTEEPYIV